MVHKIKLMQAILFPINPGFSVSWCFAVLYNGLLIFITHSRTSVGKLDRESDNLMSDLISTLKSFSFGEELKHMNTKATHYAPALHFSFPGWKALL